MTQISETQLHSLNDDFRRFKTHIIKRKKQDNAYFVSQINSFRKKYKKAGLEKIFADNLFNFAEKMRKFGIDDLPGMIFSYLMKVSFLKSDIKEIYAQKGLEYAQEKRDVIHVLARLVDLEKLYKQNKDFHKYTNVLFQEEKVLITICNNFNYAKKNYRTYSREHNQLKHYELELAKTRVDIAKVILKTNPKQAKNILEKARQIFERESRQKEVDYVNQLLTEILNIMIVHN